MSPIIGVTLIVLLLSFTNAQITVELVDTAVLVNEGEQFTLRVRKSGPITTTIHFVVEVDRNDDFIGNSQVGSFYPGGPDVSSVTFTVFDDTIPEIVETYTFRLDVKTEGVTMGTKNIAAVTIKANDDAYGVFSFIDQSPQLVVEDIVTTVVNLRIGREKGTNGRISVSFLVNSSNPDAIPGLDITPSTGSIEFQSGETINYLQLQIRADNIPENNEEFTITLTGASEGARVDSTDLLLIIQANDAPIRFQLSEYRVDEGPETRTINIQVLRGIDSDGETRIGSVSSVATVDYVVIPDTATSGIDFRVQSNQVVFDINGQTHQFIPIVIVNDSNPEVEEKFQIILSEPKGDVVRANPYRITIIINANDSPFGVISFMPSQQISVPSIMINEDGETTALFTVIRTGGTFGTVSVSWVVYRNDSVIGDVRGDLVHSGGVLVFQPGITQAKINITVLKDEISEPAERFVVRLLPTSVSGGATVEGITDAILLIQDSDNYYGIVEFAEDNEQRIIISSDPRTLSLTLKRAGYNQESIKTNITVTYNGPGANVDDVIETSEIEVVFQSGQNSRLVQIPISSSAFLQVGGQFSATVLSVVLERIPPLGAYNTPTLGSKTTTLVPVTITEANGEIGFQSTTSVLISEPETVPYQVLVKLTREGTSERAGISWSLAGSGDAAGSVTSSDTGPTSGIVYMEAGLSETTLAITIMPDDIPEVDEEVTVTLTSVQPADTQRLKAGLDKIKIIIAENDNPGGTFQFSTAMKDSYLIQEGIDTVDVVVERIGGDLVTRWVQYSVIPNGILEFYGATNVLRFNPGVKYRNSTLLAKADGIPEIQESYNLSLQSYGNISTSIGARSVIQIRVTENDNPNGVIQFQDPAVYYMNESKDGISNFLSIMVQRTMGRFGSVTVMWNINPKEGNDLVPVSGSITFGEGQDQGFIRVESVADDIPEPPEMFVIELSQPGGGALLNSSANRATVIINQNDNPLYFEDSEVQVTEPSLVTLTLKLDGDIKEKVTLSYHTVDASAVAANGDYTAITSAQVVFNVGDTEKIITASVLEDTVPEGNETFFIRIYQLEGDVVLTRSPNASITILANDNGYGVFLFNAPYERTVEEGSSAVFEIGRDQGRHGSVEVFWEIIDTLTNQALEEGGDFIVANGSVVFKETEFYKYITIIPRVDNVPEKEKLFRVDLSRVVVLEGLQDETLELAKLSDHNTEVTLKVLASDDPNGQFAFALTSRERSVAEDYYAGQDQLSRASFTVERRQGVFGKVMVSWEVFSDQVAGNLPQIYDFIFLSEISDSIKAAPIMRRPGTGTDVLDLKGAVNHYVTVPQSQHPGRDGIQNGFSISAWVQPFSSSVNGYILAKTTPSGSRFLYTLKLITGPTGAILLFGFSQTGSNSNNQVSATANKVLHDSKWHHILVTIGTGTVTFYVDGLVIGARSIGSQPLIDAPGSLLIGAIAPGNERFVGYLQDVRLFSGPLQGSEISEIYKTPSYLDVTPISGYLSYIEGERNQYITISSVPDTEEEDDEVFTVRLINAKYGASLSQTDALSTLKVLKSDYANGFFGFVSCEPNRAVTEKTTITCTVDRQRGDDGNVNVTWAIFQLTDVGDVQAINDFIVHKQVIVFTAGQRIKTFTVQVRDDDIPEPMEMFEIRLVSVSTGDGSASTNISGASIDPTRSRSSLVIDGNDFVNGLLQFSSSSVVPSPSDGIIPPATVRPEVRTSEESGFVSLLVVRAQGTVGEISVEWKTTDGTAKSVGKVPLDYAAGVGRLTFRDGELHRFINIAIIDNLIPESEKTFTVSLVNPTGGAATGIASTITVVIDHSDGAYGVFQFDDASLSVMAQELGDSGYNSVFLDIVRLQGNIGAVGVTWKFLGDPGNDVMETNGTVIFPHGMTKASIQVKIRGDTEPELDKMYQIQLTGTQQGNLGLRSKLTANLTVVANDNPYGVFTFPDTVRPLQVEERHKNITLRIQRLYGVFGSVIVTYRTLSPNENFPYLPSPVLRASQKDFKSTTGYVLFETDVTEKELYIEIFDDVEPENDESIFIQLTNVTVISQPQEGLGSISAILGQQSQTYAQVIIRSNDNANGALELSPLSTSVSESLGQLGVGVNVVRKGGSFGQVSVKFQVLNGTAYENLDFVVLSDKVFLFDGETSKPLSIQIIDDQIPELTEAFYIKLVDQNEGGAVLGSSIDAVVKIEPSDDPVGAFEFAVNGVTNEEPELGSPTFVNITVVRTGGTMGVVSVRWEAMLNGELPSLDISPTSGSIHFVSNEASQHIMLAILPDDIPEGQEDIKLKLINATNGGRIGLRNEFTLTVPPNDNPHGTIKFSSGNYTVEEKDTNDIQYIGLTRFGGLYGQLRVYFSTEQIDIIDEATLGGATVLSYFNAPQSGSRGVQGNQVDVFAANNPSEICGTACLRIEGCVAFEVFISNNIDDGNTCMWYTTTATLPLNPSTAHMYYVKDMNKVSELFGHRASAGQDYGAVTNGYVLVNEGSTSGSVPLSILADSIPELDEKFQVRLLRVEVASAGASAKYPPSLGDVTKATVTIQKNDNAFGIFTIYSDSLSAVENGHVTSVEEKPRLAVDLIVERQGGSLGTVSVDWYINITASSAIYGKDFLADGATLQFTPGQTRRMIALTVLDDVEPEENKTVIVQLRNPQGGADVAKDANVKVIILENDNVAGILRFDTTSILATEGDKIAINITRTLPALGTVSVDWNIQGMNGLNPELGFEDHQGSFIFLPGEVSKTISLLVLKDDRPETNEEYRIHLSNVQTQGIGPTGAANIDPLYQTASITIQGSDNPHGVIQFAADSLNVREEERDVIIQLNIDRKFGSIGKIRVSYEITNGSVSALTEDLLAATPNDDFVPTRTYIDVPNDVVTAPISVQIKDDDLPEVDEVFVVTLTGVMLIDSDGSSMPPTLGQTGTKAQVIINANDGTKGVAIFTSDSASVAVDEITKNITLSVFRDKGTFGNVSVFYYAQSITEGTTPGTDYIITPQDLTFTKGEDRKLIFIEILNDDLPEPDETFEVILSNPRDGLTLGTPSRAKVTILANDGASGVVSFDSGTVVMVDEASGDNSSMGIVQLAVVRGPGIYGVVNVPFEVVPDFPENSNDLSPSRGYITFQDRESTALIELTALDDNLPEQTERFTVRLLNPDNEATLGNIQQKTVIINSNDSPNGLLQIYARGTTNTTISVDENIGMLMFDIRRTQGHDGKITVDMATQPGTALVNSDLTEVTLSPLQVLPANQVKAWYSFTVNGTVYMVMLTSFRVGDLSTGVGSNGSSAPVNVDRLLESTLFRWQGELIPLQTIETDIGVSATSFTVDGVTYLVVANRGNLRRYQTKSRVYKVNDNGVLLVLQDLQTSGVEEVEYFSRGSDHFIVFANAKDNNAETLVSVDVYKWDSSTKMFTPLPWQSLSNLGCQAVEVFVMEGVTYLAVANHYNSQLKTFQVDSVIYKLGADLRFSEHQRIRTQGAIDVKYLLLRSLHLLVFANNRGDTISSPQLSTVYRWDSTVQMFFKHADIETNRVESMETFIGSDDTGHLVVANGIGNSGIYSWDLQEQKFVQVWSGPPAMHMLPVTIHQSTGPLTIMPIASKEATDNATIYQFMKVKNSDFSPRTVTLTFEPRERLRHTSVVILQDDIPEDTETFYVILSNPTGGVEIGAQNKITVNILSNDNAHGIIEIAEDSLEVRVQEEDNRDNTVQINVVRRKGFFGRVVARWLATGDQNGLNDITPLEGIIEFANGQSVATISLTILNDNLAELPEVTYIRLTEILEPGTTLPGRGAQIGPNNVAKLIVQANDSPYGVVLWEKGQVMVSEPNGTDFTQVLYIVRQQGIMGQLHVTFQTDRDNSQPINNQALSGEDYVARQGMVVIQENVTRVPVEIVIRQDTVPEGDESFIVNITGVTLSGITPPAGAEPSVKIPGNVVAITITENDNARGIVQFNVTTNVEGRVDSYEEYGMNTSLKLKVSRSVGYLGSVTVTWQAEPREATVLDFTPSTGTIRLEDGQSSADIIITILDDTIAEEMETFDVKLLSVTGGSQLGPTDTVKVAILKNDSPNGLFRFVQTEVVVKESTTLSDPGGVATLDIERLQGAEGVVNVQWRLNAEAAYDFVEPLTNTILFSQGENRRTVTLRTKPDEILEGQERFIISLITADNNADISHTRGDAAVIISPDPGASGTISILPQYRQMYIGEPGESSPSYNGQVQIVLTRGLGIYGEIDVTWSLTPREATQFLQIEGTVHFADLQQTATITVQAQDDTFPERPKTFILQLNSATNGATVSRLPGSFTANILFVASDYPHGLFEFTLPQITSITEDMFSVTVPVIRRFGLDSKVLVFFTTTAGTAMSYDDFSPATGNLQFQHGEQRKMIEIRIVQDDVPEGPEQFYVNLTSTRLVLPSENNYTIISGLQIDMKPAIGGVNYKTILIDKNDNAEGTIEFDPSAVQFTVVEESGMAKIPLVRKGGNYGQVTVTFSVQNSTAMEGIDYVVPTRQVVFMDGDRSKTIDIKIQDDNLMEFAERFIVKLEQITGGAVFGDLTTATVTIAKSDYPNGRFGFKGQLHVTVANPSNRTVKQVLSIERTGGITGSQMVYWRILGPNNPRQVLLETNDINAISNNQEVTSGSLKWNDQEAGVKTFEIFIKPYTTWEIEKTFVFEIYNIQGSPQGVGDGEVGPTTGNFTITISKFGDPNGIILFSGIAQSERTVDEPDTGMLTLRFPIVRRLDSGTVGSVQVFWEVEGPIQSKPDIQPQNGSVIIGDELRDADILIRILADDEPELTESFKVILKRVEGGAEFDTRHIISYFKIRYNDYPHGQFGIIPRYQTIIVKPADLSRHVKLNFTRHDGTFGPVLLSFNIKYDVPQSNIVINNNGGTVSFDDGMKNVIIELAIEGDGFLAIDSTFSVTLLDVQYLGQGVTIPPRFMLGETSTKVIVPSVAANSEVGFKDVIATVDEVTTTSLITVIRRGTYGTIDVSWQSDLPGDPPTGYLPGKITPQLGTLTIAHGIESRNFTVELSPLADMREYFALHLPQAPVTTVPGGTRLVAGIDVLKIEPFGLFRFAANSTSPIVSELEGKLYLKVQRLYGSVGKIEVTYRSQEITATKHLDYVTMETNAVVMEPGQTSGLILVQVVQDNIPEEEEKLYINLTHVEKYPTELVPKISPRLSSLHSHSVVTIGQSNDPYGVLCLEPSYISVEEQYRTVNLTIQRTGGVYGTVSVVVRTVGGGETWTSQIAILPSSSGNDTITQILSNRNPRNVATGGLDYEVLDTKVIFQQGEEVKFVTVTILSDSMAEHEETVIVYLTQPTGGARIATGSLDGGKKGFTVITIEQNDLSNGIIGFAERSKVVTVNEDTSPTFRLELSRINTIVNGEVEVSWVAKLREDSTPAEDGRLSEQLERTAGTAICPGEQSACYFNVSLKNDQTPEEGHNFFIKLTSVRRDAQLNLQSLYAAITVESSDYVRGLLQFTHDSRIIVVAKNHLNATLKVERQKGIGYEVGASFQTMQMTGQVTDHGIIINPALESEDFTRNVGTVTFEANKQDIKYINVRLTPVSSSTNPYPKQLYVQLKNPTNGASVHPDSAYSRAFIRIVEESTLPIWKIIIDKGSVKNDSDIVKTLADLDAIAGDDGMDNEEITLVEGLMDEIINEGKNRGLPNQIIKQALGVLCKMLNPNRNDATRGRTSLAEKMENLAYAALVGKTCPTPHPTEVLQFQCAYAKMSAARWLLGDIQQFKYQGSMEALKLDTFTVPETIPDPPIPSEGNCQDFHVIEYSSEQWFMRSDQTELLNNKVIGFGIKGRESSRIEKPAKFRIYTADRRIATRRAQCVYYDMGVNDWVGSNGICQITNNLDLGVDDYVDCSCNHMTHYGVKATSLDPGLVGYSVWFYVACFVCMICMALAIMVHHICASLYSMFSASLLMHMCFACFATQLCYLVAAYLSPNEILVYQLGQDNYKCIVMGLFLHYFFLTQFTWIMAQSINFWKILVMNDEHTDRKYVLFFLMGWGLPVVILAIFYVVTFNLYKYVYSLPVDFIYGDVNNNQEICFITNPYAALGGILLPVLLMLVLVIIVFVKAFQVTPQWQAYDDIYRGRYNIDEIRTLLLFWSVITLTWLWGGLHLVYGQLWMLILFCIFDIIQGILALVLYCILRNPCLQQCFGPGKKMYSISAGDLADINSVPHSHHHPHHHHHSLENGSLKGSRASMIEGWERDSTIPSKSTMKVKRTLPSSGNIYVTPPVLMRTPETEHTDKDFDDLLFVLKSNGSYTASDANSLLDSDKLSDISSKIDKYEMRRISIADTHL